jgi:hypothetical protein
MLAQSAQAQRQASMPVTTPAGITPLAGSNDRNAWQGSLDSAAAGTAAEVGQQRRQYGRPLGNVHVHCHASGGLGQQGSPVARSASGQLHAAAMQLPRTSSGPSWELPGGAGQLLGGFCQQSNAQLAGLAAGAGSGGGGLMALGHGPGGDHSLLYNANSLGGRQVGAGPSSGLDSEPLHGSPSTAWILLSIRWGCIGCACHGRPHAGHPLTVTWAPLSPPPIHPPALASASCGPASL